MAILSRGFDDILIDRVESAIKDFLEEQLLEATSAAERKAITYKTERDRTEPPGVKELPIVIPWADTSAPEAKGASAKTFTTESVTINVDLIAGYETDDASIPSGPAARKRLIYLKEQVRNALYRLINADFGFEPGVISSKSWPTWTLYKDEGGNPEASVVGGRWSFTVSYQWTAEPITGVPLAEVSIDSGLFSGLYQIQA